MTRKPKAGTQGDETEHDLAGGEHDTQSTSMRAALDAGIAAGRAVAAQSGIDVQQEATGIEKGAEWVAMEEAHLANAEVERRMALLQGLSPHDAGADDQPGDAR